MPVVRELEPAELVWERWRRTLRVHSGGRQGRMLGREPALAIPASLQFQAARIGVIAGASLFVVLGPLLRIPAEFLYLAIGASLALLAGASSFWAP